MKFKDLGVYLDKLEKTSSRIEITKILSELFNKAQSDEIDKIVYLLLGSLAPRYKGIVFNIAERMMLQSLSEAYSSEKDKVQDLYKKLGDLGEVAAKLGMADSKTQADKSNPSVIDVYSELLRIAEDEGEGSQDRKIKDMANLLTKLDSSSARFVARIPVGKLRLGFSDKTILDALSWMKTGDKSRKKELEMAYNVLPDVGLLARAVKTKGIERAAKQVKPVAGVPVLPMLAQRLKSPKDMIEKMGEVAVEAKFDGLRIQIHFKRSGFNGKKDHKVKAYTRNLNENSWMFPELNSLGKHINSKEVILDTEAIGVDEERKSLANFQQTMTRRRKHRIDEIASKMAIKFYVFDLLLVDGRSVIDKTYIERRKLLEKVIKDGKLLEVVGYEITKNSDRINVLMRQELKDGLEGIIVKRANSRYVAGRTGWRWVKMKEEETSHAKLVDTVDCVIMGYTGGKGKRAGFGIGQFLAGVIDGQKIKSITKVGTGLTDDQFRQLKKRLGKIETKDMPKGYEVPKDLEPDFWVEPKQVVELAADEITKSPKHKSGYALRFPRLISFRDDKSKKSATTLSEMKKMFKLQ
jgi:DNA ligase-1